MNNLEIVILLIIFTLFLIPLAMIKVDWAAWIIAIWFICIYGSMWEPSENKGVLK